MSSVDRQCARLGLPDVLIGSLIDDRYKIRGTLGTGNFGFVYEAEHEIFGHVIRRVALKLLKQPGLRRDDVAENFSDALAAARIAERHRGNDFVQNIVAVLDAGLCAAWDYRGYVVMELVQRDLRDEMQRYPDRQLPIGLALDYARQICRGVSLAHAMEPPVVHRDLKPPNVLIGSRGEAKVSDFGLAKAVGYLTGDAEGAGDLSCQAPESLNGIAMPASDVYSIGLTIYEMVTGVHPFQDLLEDLRDGSAKDVSERHLRRRGRPIRPAAELNGQLKLMPDFSAIIQRCLQPEPIDRYRDAAALLAALDDVGRSKRAEPAMVVVKKESAPLDCQYLLEQSLRCEQGNDLETALQFVERVCREADTTRDRAYIAEALFRSGQLKGKLGRIDDAVADLYRAQVEFRHTGATRLRVELARGRTSP